VLVNQNQTALPDEPLPPKLLPNRVTRFVFVGRITAKKNLDMTLSAMQHLTTAAEFDIFGPIEDSKYWKRCQYLIDRLPSHVTAKYCGELSPSEARGIVAEYDVFVIPTLGENFGHSIAESLSASCPVLASDETPWTLVLERGGGVAIRSISTEALARELQRWAAMTPTQKFGTRIAAAGAYKRWRAELSDANILDEFLLSTRKVGDAQPLPIDALGSAEEHGRARSR
jgi:glycosyltransferase involved in cell wall biosynthesis